VKPEQELQVRTEEAKQQQEPYVSVEQLTAKDNFIAGELLGRPTDSSVTVNVVAADDFEAYFEYGTEPCIYTGRTHLIKYPGTEPIEAVIDKLQPNTRYYYRMRYRQPGESEFSAREEYTFHTQRPPGSSFRFTVQSDSHGRDPNRNFERYKTTLINELADQPDFIIDLGDTFFMKGGVNNYDEVIKIFIEERQKFGLLCHSAPLFFVIGNHDGESGQRLNGNSENLAVWSTKTRKLYIPNPTPDDFYTGSTTIEDFVGLRENYYAWEWGDALFVVLDPNWYTITPSMAWDRTLGQQQYSWFKETLEQSDAKVKFVFIHQLVGGHDSDRGRRRGGLEPAKYFEWGGLNKDDDSWGFDERRPGWGKPIHQLMVENNVTIFFHGHDHFYAKQDLDGIVYQLLPEPNHAGGGGDHAADYGYVSGVFLDKSGHLRVTVSENKVTVDYIRAYLPQEENEDKKNGEVEYSYTINSD